MKVTTMNTALLDLPYYHPHFTDVNQVCDILTPYVYQDGTYLLRDSKSRPGTLTISVMHNHQVNHFNIESRESYGYLLYEKYFKTVGELVEYYRTNDIPNREHIKHIRLTNPIYSTRVTKEERRPSIGLSESQSSGSSTDAVARHPIPRQRSVPEADTNETEDLHPPRRVQSERLESREQRGSVEPALPFPPAAKEPITARLRKLIGGTPKSRSPSESSEGSAISMGSSGNRQSDSVLPYDPADRPQPPIPKQNGECNYRPPCVGAEGYNDPQENIYSEPRPEVDQTKQLLTQLKLDEELRARNEMCHCGIRVMDSELPHGWSVHRSEEQETQGRLFFVSADNATSWTLPKTVVAELTPRQRQTLARLRNEVIRPGIYRLTSQNRDL